MSTKFIVKTKVKKDPKTQEEKPAIHFMKAEMPYCVLDVWKYREKNKETDTYSIVTKFLVGDDSTGLLHWVDSHGIDFISIL